MINHDVMRSENALQVLRCIQEKGPIYRREVKELTGLSSGSISKIVSELIEKGIVKEIVKDVKQRGRNAYQLDVNTDSSCMIGIDINSAGITVVLMNLKCVVYSTFFENVLSLEYDSVIQQIYRMLDGITEHLKNGAISLLGIGVAMQGTVNREEGISQYCPYLKGWKDIPIRAMLEERYGCSVLVEHSPDCMALFENWFGAARGASDFLFIRAGNTIGMSIVENGKVLHGYNNNAGEFGHMIIEPFGKKCSCGSFGCLETVASQKSIIEYILEEKEKGRDTLLLEYVDPMSADTLNMDLIYRACCHGDALCLEAMNRMAFYFGIAISNVINLLNPELIVVGGDLAAYEVFFLAKLKKTVEERAWSKSTKTIHAETPASFVILNQTV